MPKYTSSIIIINAIPGNGMASEIISMRAITTIIIILYPDSDNPVGVGKKNSTSAIMVVINSHRFCVNQ